MRPIIACAVLLCLGSPLLRAQPRILRPDDPAAREIDAAGVELLEKIRAEDAAGAKALLAGPKDQHELVDAYIRWMVASKSLMKAVTRFGNDDRLSTLDLADHALAMRIEGIPLSAIVANGDRACISSPGAFYNPGLRVERVGDRWRVTHLVARPEWTGVLKETLTRLADGFARAAEGVASGKVKDSDSALALVRAAIDPAIGLWLRVWSVPPTAGAAGPVQSLEPDQVQACIGTDLWSGPAAGLIASMSDLPTVTHGPTCLWLDSPTGGMQLRFNAEPSTGRLLLALIALYSNGADGHLGYPGKLPHGLAFGMARRDIERKLGRPSVSSGVEQYGVDYPALGLSLEYARDARDPANPLAEVSISAKDADAPPPLRNRPSVAFRLVADPRDTKAEWTVDADDPTGKLKHPLEREVLLDASHIANVHIDLLPEDLKATVLAVDFTKEGAACMARISRQYQGRRMVIVVDGKIVLSSRIEGPLDDRVMVVFPGSVQRTTVARLVGRLHAAVFALPDETPSTRPAQ